MIPGWLCRSQPQRVPVGRLTQKETFEYLPGILLRTTATGQSHCPAFHPGSARASRAQRTAQAPTVSPRDWAFCHPRRCAGKAAATRLQGPHEHHWGDSLWLALASALAMSDGRGPHQRWCSALDVRLRLIFTRFPAGRVIRRGGSVAWHQSYCGTSPEEGTAFHSCGQLAVVLALSAAVDSNL